MFQLSRMNNHSIFSGAGLALLGALSNNRPHYGHYPSRYPTPASPAYPNIGHSPYPVPARPAYPSYPRPATPAQPAYHSYAPSPYPNSFGGYRPGYPYGRSQDVLLEESNETNLAEEAMEISKGKLPEEKDVHDQDEEGDKESLLSEGTSEGGSALEDQNGPSSKPIGENGIILYPAVIEDPVIIPSTPTPTYFLPNTYRFYNAELLQINPYQTQVLPIDVEEYPSGFVKYHLQYRAKRSPTQNDDVNSTSNELNLEMNEHVNLTEMSDILQKNNSETDINLTNIRLDKLEKYRPPAEIITPKTYFERITRKDEKVFSNNVSQSELEERKKKKKPSKGSLLAAGLLGAAAGAAITNVGVKAYNNRYPHYGGSPYGVPQYANPYIGHHPNGYFGNNVGYHPGGYVGHAVARPPFYPQPVPARPAAFAVRPPVPARPAAIATRPPFSPYYYPHYRTIPLNNEKIDIPIQSKGNNETRFIILSTHLEPAQAPNRFPYNQQYYYELNHPANTQQQETQHVVQPQVLLPNRFVYVYGQPFVQNQFRLTSHDSEKTTNQ